VTGDQQQLCDLRASHEERHDVCTTFANMPDKDFYDEHPIIKFDTLFGFGEYEVVAVFKL
jgi:hypothetical protein